MEIIASSITIPGDISATTGIGVTPGSINVNVNGTLKELLTLSINVDGTLKELSEVVTNVNGTLKGIFSTTLPLPIEKSTKSSGNIAENVILRSNVYLTITISLSGIVSTGQLTLTATDSTNKSTTLASPSFTKTKQEYSASKILLPAGIYLFTLTKPNTIASTIFCSISFSKTPF